MCPCLFYPCPFPFSLSLLLSIGQGPPSPPTKRLLPLSSVWWSLSLFLSFPLFPLCFSFLPLPFPLFSVSSSVYGPRAPSPPHTHTQKSLLPLSSVWWLVLVLVLVLSPFPPVLFALTLALSPFFCLFPCLWAQGPPPLRLPLLSPLSLPLRSLLPLTLRSPLSSTCPCPLPLLSLPLPLALSSTLPFRRPCLSPRYSFFFFPCPCPSRFPLPVPPPPPQKKTPLVLALALAYALALVFVLYLSPFPLPHKKYLCPRPCLSPFPCLWAPLPYPKK